MSNASLGRVEMRGVTRRFGERVAVGPLDLDIEPGSFVALVGPSGCGKTTLLRLLCALDTPSKGTISIDGMSPDGAAGAKRFALIPQQPALLPWRSVEDNVRLTGEVNRKAGRVADADVDHWLAVTKLDHVRKQRPDTLSGGMRQRVAIARAMAMRAPVLLADEPFANLDELTRDGVLDALASACDEVRPTVVIVTHSPLEAVLLADRVVVLGGHPGRIIDDRHISLPRPRRAVDQDSAAVVEEVAALRRVLRTYDDRAAS
jgi:NitT/TauT family transport system ATP-binding protein